MDRIAIFVDVQNIYYTTRQAFGRQFNYREFWRQIERQGKIVSANAYAIQRDDNRQQKFQSALTHIGFRVKLKPYIQRSDGSAKGDWDVGIAIDILEKSTEVDRIILLSGDGDFDLLLDKVKQKYGITADVYGVAALTANSLVAASTNFYAIDQALLLPA